MLDKENQMNFEVTKPLTVDNSESINKLCKCLLKSAGFTALLASSAILVACGNSDGTPTNVSVYKYVGSVQCSGGGIPISTLQRQLTDAGIQVQTASCGSDGNIYVAVCGAADGRIAIFDVPVTEAQTATELGFAPLSNLPSATKVACQ